MKSMLFAFGIFALVAGANLAVVKTVDACGCCAKPAVAPASVAPSCHAATDAKGPVNCPNCAVAVLADEKAAPAAKDAPAAKEVTLDGTIQCAKCSLKETKQCTTAIVVKEGDKNVTYYFADKGNGESYHENVCGGGKAAGTVTGKAFEKDGKMWITPTKVAYKK